MTGTKLWLEVGPLAEGNYTGISQVTAALAGCMLADTARACGFFFGQAVVPAAIVADMVARRQGRLLGWTMARIPTHDAPDDPALRHAAIFPNRKTARGLFECEAQVIHDLSTLLTPQFHDAGTVDYHALSLRDDVQSNQLTFCVSEATRGDVLAYLGPLDPARVITTRLAAGPHVPAGGPQVGHTVEPYVLVLGTIEPRKNIGQVLAFLADQPQLLGALRFVFLGRYGWGASVEELLGAHGLHEAFDAGRIVFPGYVSDAARIQLTRHARLLVYPSLFEGFGLPVLEALALGTPCLTTISSSLPEAGGRVCSYFDPFVPGDFARGFAAALAHAGHGRAARVAWAERFSWAGCYGAMTGAIDAWFADGEQPA